MASAAQVRNSKLMTKFQRDLELYRDELGKTTNEVLATKVLDFSIKYRALWKKEAPSKGQIDDEARERGYNVKVSGRIAKAAGAIDGSSLRRGGTDYRGRFRRRHLGVTHTNRRSWAVSRELAKRRSSVKWLQRSVPVWRKQLNKNVPEGGRDFASAYTARRSSRVADTKGTFTGKTDRIVVDLRAFGAEEADVGKGDLHITAIRKSQQGTSEFLNKRAGKAFAKNVKKVYR